MTRIKHMKADERATSATIFRDAMKVSTHKVFLYRRLKHVVLIARGRIAYALDVGRRVVAAAAITLGSRRSSSTLIVWTKRGGRPLCNRLFDGFSA